MVLILTTPVDESTAHTEEVEVVYDTVRPDDTVAPAANAGSSKSLPAIAGNVIV
jgi:hypothetical protein